MGVQRVVILALAIALGLALAARPARSAEPGPPLETIAVLGFELVDDQPDPAREATLRRRLAALQQQLAAGLQAQGLYRVVDSEPARELIEAERMRQEFLYRCNACLSEIARRLHTRLVVVGWVQRVSELILNINVLVKDADTDAELLMKSVDLRGNTDETWERGMRFMLRDWAERRARNPRYGR